VLSDSKSAFLGSLFYKLLRTKFWYFLVISGCFVDSLVDLFRIRYNIAGYEIKRNATLMSHLTKLTISSATRQISNNPVDARRAKLLAKLNEQLAMATAFVENQPFSVTRKVWAEQEDGTKQRIERAKRLNAWYWQDVSGKFLFEVRYGAQKLELAKGKHAIDVGDKSKLIGVIMTIIEAVKGGELDGALNTTADSKLIKQKSKS
jgi:hypothetical protein